MRFGAPHGPVSAHGCVLVGTHHTVQPTPTQQRQQRHHGQCHQQLHQSKNLISRWHTPSQERPVHQLRPALLTPATPGHAQTPVHRPAIQPTGWALAALPPVAPECGLLCSQALVVSPLVATGAAAVFEPGRLGHTIAPGRPGTGAPCICVRALLACKPAAKAMAVMASATHHSPK